MRAQRLQPLAVLVDVDLTTGQTIVDNFLGGGASR
jgi:hypothetical protein